MPVLFLWYPNCSTCQRAKRLLDALGVDYIPRDIKAQRPQAEELAEWRRASGLPVKKFVNTSGQLYRAMNLKERISAMEADDLYSLLATDGMLVKRPLLIGNGFVLTGFREQEWRAVLERKEQE